MTSRSPSPNLYDDDEFDSPTPSEHGGIRPPSIPFTPSPGSSFSIAASKPNQLPTAVNGLDDNDSRASARNDFQHRSLTREQTFITTNDSRLSRHTYTAPDGDYYDDDFDKDDDFHSERSYTPHHSERSYTPHHSERSYTPHHSERSYTPHHSERSYTPHHSERSYTPRDSKRSHTPHDSKESHSLDHVDTNTGRDINTEMPNPQTPGAFHGNESSSRKLIDVTNMSPGRSATSTQRPTNESGQTNRHNDTTRVLGSRNHTNLSFTKSVKRLPYSNRKSVRSVRNGASRMSTTSRQLDVTDLRQEMRTIGDEIEALKIENKVLKRNNILLTHQLDKREKEEQEIPSLYDRQVKELRVLKDQLRRQQERYDKVHYRLRRTEKSLASSHREEIALEKKAEDCELKERSRLRKQLEKVESESAICDEKIRQMEKYVENLEKCHDAEMAVEREKQRETQGDIDRIGEQMQAAKQSMQEKENELERFRIQRVTHVANARTLMSSLSGSPKLPTHQRPDAQVGHLRALPAPPVKDHHEVTHIKRHEVTPARAIEVTPPRGHEVTPARGHEVTPVKRHEVTPTREHEVTPATDDDIPSNKQITPSPPPNSRPNQRNSRAPKTKNPPEKPVIKPMNQKAPLKHAANSKAAARTVVDSTAQPAPDKNDEREEIKKVIDEEKKAELLRTNMALSQTEKTQKPSDHIQPTVVGKAALLTREDSWAAVKAAQANITAAGGEHDPQFDSSGAVNKSMREMTFAIGMSPSGVGEEARNKPESNASLPEAAKKKQAQADEKKAALLNDTSVNQDWQKSIFSEQPETRDNNSVEFSNAHRVEQTTDSLFARNAGSDFGLNHNRPSPSHKPYNELQFNNAINGSHALQLGSNSSNSFADKQGDFWEAESSASTKVPRRRETTIINRKPATDIFGDVQFN